MRTATSIDFFFEQMGRFQLLDDATTMELANKVQAWQQHPNGPDFAPIQIRLHGNAARDKLVRHNLRLVVHIWKSSYQGRLSISNPGLIDALQTASMNLVRAAEKFTAKRGTKFSTYASPWIHKGFKDYLYSEERMVRIPANSFHLIKAAQAMIGKARDGGEPIPTPEQLVEELSKTRKHVPTAKALEQWLKSAAMTDPLSLSLTMNDGDDGSSLGDVVSSKPSADEDEHLASVREAMEFLSEIEQKVIRKRYLGKRVVRHESIGKEVGLSRSRVQQIEAQAVRSIRNLAGISQATRVA